MNILLALTILFAIQQSIVFSQNTDKSTLLATNFGNGNGNNSDAAPTDTIPSNTPFPTNAPINCSYSGWTQCYNPQNCGTGTQSTINVTPAVYGGIACPDSPRSCVLNPCPVDCSYSGWTQCYNAQNCGTGTQSIINVTPAAYGGIACPGSPRNCTLNPCPVDCVWSVWSVCSAACGNGIMTRTKTPALYGGKDCVGSAESTCILKQCSDVGSGGFTSDTTTSNPDTTFIFLSSNTRQSATSSVADFIPVTPSPTPFPTSPPPIPTNSPIPTRVPNNFQIPPTEAPTVRPTLIPTLMPTSIPTLIPTIPFLPSSLTSQVQSTSSKTTFLLNTNILTEIKIVPNAVAAERGPTAQPLLPQEQAQQTNEPPQPGGILVTLQQKIGSMLVTRQDELTVKRGNQFFTISNQTNTTPDSTTNNQSQQSGTKTNTAPAPLLEINANNVIAQSSMGLLVDPLSGILTVETPSGPQRVSIMPDEALGIVMELKALSTGGTAEKSILLVSEKGALIYRISGEKVEKFLGLFPLNIQKQILISADTGSIVKVELTLLSQILSYFTF